MSMIRVLDAPVHQGAGQPGCDFGPGALRAAGLIAGLAASGSRVVDCGAVQPRQPRPLRHGNLALKALPQVSAWAGALAEAAFAASEDTLPVFLGGDHSLSAGTLAGLSRRATAVGRPLFVLWLDAHSDFHTLETSVSGNLHGVPLAYASGRPGFSGYFPDLAAAVDPRRICMFGLRSVDAAEETALTEAGVIAHDMATIRARGVAPLLTAFLAEVAAANGLLHVSFDVDVLDPALAPAVGTPVPHGATFEEAAHIASMLHESRLVTSLDLVELNPRLDVEGRTAGVFADLAAQIVTGRGLPGEVRP